MVLGTIVAYGGDAYLGKGSYNVPLSKAEGVKIANEIYNTNYNTLPSKNEKDICSTYDCLISLKPEELKQAIDNLTEQQKKEIISFAKKDYLI